MRKAYLSLLVRSFKPLVNKFSQLHHELVSVQKELAEQRRAAERDVTVLLLGETVADAERTAIESASLRGSRIDGQI